MLSPAVNRVSPPPPPPLDDAVVVVDEETEKITAERQTLLDELAHHRSAVHSLREQARQVFYSLSLK
jgi:prefoldin subunit 5